MAGFFRYPYLVERVHNRLVVVLSDKEVYFGKYIKPRVRACLIRDDNSLLVFDIVDYCDSINVILSFSARQGTRAV